MKKFFFIFCVLCSFNISAQSPKALESVNLPYCVVTDSTIISIKAVYEGDDTVITFFKPYIYNGFVVEKQDRNWWMVWDSKTNEMTLGDTFYMLSCLGL